MIDVAVPTLRFPEFDGGWARSKLNQVGQVIDGDRGVNYPSSADFSKIGDCLFLNAKNVTKTGFRFDETMFISFSCDAKLSKGKAKRGDVILTTRGSVGNFAIYDEKIPYNDIRINSGMVIIRLNDINIFPIFFYAYSQSKILSRYVEIIAFGSAQPQLTVKEILKFPVALPTLPEQQKIADFLGAVDARVGLLRRRRDALRAYKKGMMQRLFSQELRFTKPDGSPFPDWQEKRLGEVSETVTGSSNREDSTEQGDYVFFDRSSDVRASARFLFDSEAIIVAGEGKDFPPRHFVGKFDLHQRTYATMNFGNNSGRFLFYWIDWHRAHFLKHSVGSTMPSLRMGSFSHFPVSLPHPEEQQKIADTLTALDTKIEAVTAQMDAMLRFKKGLLQQMFV